MLATTIGARPQPAPRPRPARTASRRGVPPAGGIAYAQRAPRGGLPGRAHRQHLAVGRPAERLPARVTPVRQPARAAAVDVARRRPPARRPSTTSTPPACRPGTAAAERPARRRRSAGRPGRRTAGRSRRRPRRRRRACRRAGGGSGGSWRASMADRDRIEGATRTPRVHPHGGRMAGMRKRWRMLAAGRTSRTGGGGLRDVRHGRLLGTGTRVGRGRRRRERAPAATGAPGTTVAPTRTGTPELQVEVVASGLSHVWDIGFLPDGRALVTERDGRIALLSGTAPGATVTQVDADLSDVLRPRRGRADGHGRAPRLRAVPAVHHLPDPHARTAPPPTSGSSPGSCRPTARRRPASADPLVGGLPINPSGRHSGCRPTIAAGRRAARRHRRHRPRRHRAGPHLARRQGAARRPRHRRARARQPVRRRRRTRRSGWSGPTATATCRAWPCSRAPATSTPPSTAPPPTTRSTGCRPGGNYGWDPSQGGTVGGYDEDGADDRPRALPRRRARRVELGQPGGGHLRRRVPVRAAVGRPRRRARRRRRCAARSCCSCASARTAPSRR